MEKDCDDEVVIYELVMRSLGSNFKHFFYYYFFMKRFYTQKSTKSTKWKQPTFTQIFLYA